MSKRQLEKDAPDSSTIDQLSYPDLIREGAEHGLIDEPKKWLEYRRYRNLTSHTYDKQKVQEVYLVAPK